MYTDLDNTALFDIGNVVFNEKESGFDDYYLPDETLLKISIQDLFKLDKNQEYETSNWIQSCN